MKALIIVDMQKDFMPGGALGVDGARDVIPVSNRLHDLSSFDLVVATQDWHPADHESFASQHPGKEPGDVIDLHGLEQVLWPDHCVQGSAGAQFADGLDVGGAVVFRKGTQRHVDSYSAFYDNGHRRSTGLTDYLRNREVGEVYIVGVATDYCVKYTALDAARDGFRTFVIRDATRGVNLHPQDTDKALREMQEAGAELMDSEKLLMTRGELGPQARAPVE